MAVLARVASAAIFIVHLAVGCCAHHAHACDGRSESHSTQGLYAHHSNCPDDHQGPADHRHHAPHDCQGSTCSVIPASRITSNLLVPLFEAFTAPALSDPPSPVGVLCEQRFFAAGPLPMPVRLHLANQVLLI
jgi:hypothetical protein